MDIVYILRVNGPDDLDGDLREEIEDGADSRDTTDEAKMRRWLGGIVSDTEHNLSVSLPDGWKATITEMRRP